MKLLPLIVLLCTLAGCALAPDSYLSVTDHAVSSENTVQTDAVLVQDYASLKRAFLSLVEAGQTQGTIWATNYDGSLEDDLTVAAYEVSKLNPLGAYAVDYMSHDCTYIVNHYEITVRITFRRTAREIASVEAVATQPALRSRLEQALNNHESRVVLRMASYREMDIGEMVAAYCRENPAAVLEQPTVSVAVYPDSGTVRILEIDMTYTESPTALESKETAVLQSVDAAAEYIRYRQTDWDKVDLLFTYLTERFTYEGGQTNTPLYDALCSGVADPRGLSQAWQLICDQAGVECYTVTGLRYGQDYTWNIVSADGYYRHLDMADCVLEQGALLLRDDTEMNDYYWNTERYPACEPYPEAPEQPPEDPETEQPPADAPEPPAEEQPAPEPEPVP